MTDDSWPGIDASHTRGVVIGRDNQQFNLPSITVVVERVGSAIDDLAAHMAQENARLQARLERLQGQLRKERTRCERLREQAADLESAVRAGAQRHRELEEYVRAAEAEAVRHIAELQAEVDAARRALTDLEDSRDQIRADREKFRQFELLLEDRALVEFERAQAAERENSRLAAELAEVSALLRRYQEANG